MKYDEFLKANRNALLGYFLISSCRMGKINILNPPWPYEHLEDDEVDNLKSELSDCMPLYSLITDLRDWDIQVQHELDDDWFFNVTFGDDSAIAVCADELAEFFIEKCAEYGMDYNQHENDYFEKYVLEEAHRFIVDWRINIWRRYGESKSCGTLETAHDQPHKTE